MAISLEKKAWLSDLITSHAKQASLDTNAALKVFGPDFISNVSLTLNPYLSFRNPGEDLVTQANRTRSRMPQHAGQAIQLIHRRDAITKSWAGNLTVARPVVTATSSSTNVIAVGAIPSSFDTMVDTTKRTRKINSLYGEAESSQVHVVEGGRSNTWVEFDGDVRLSLSGQYTTSLTNRSVKVGPCSGYLTTTAVNSLRSSEKAWLQTTLQQKAARLLTSALPAHRELDLGISIYELKDFRNLPALVREGLDQIRNMRPDMSLASFLSGAYLTKEFAIAPLISDVKKLLSLPTSLPRRIARLQKMQGKDATFHSTMKFIENGNGVAHVFPTLGVYETLVDQVNSATRSLTLRGTVNCNVRMPDVIKGLPDAFSVPSLVGLDISVADAYRVIPWTWLVDWYLSISDYLDMIVRVNSDPSLINFGFVSGKLETEFKSIAGVRHSETTYRKLDAAVITNEVRQVTVPVTAITSIRTYKRIDASTLSGLPCTSTKTGLSSWQASILGALSVRRML